MNKLDHLMLETPSYVVLLFVACVIVPIILVFVFLLSVIIYYSGVYGVWAMWTVGISVIIHHIYKKAAP